MTELEPATVATAPAGLTDADMHGCRFIEGEATPLRSGMFCCGTAPPGSSWCSRHRKIVWSYRRGRLMRPAKPIKVGGSE
jgi:hypothetical protein